MNKKNAIIDWDIIDLDETESTNLYLKEKLSDHRLKEFTIVTANFQTKGRGQMGNSWNANRGENLLFSILIYPHTILANEQFIISQAISLSIRNVLSKYTDNILVKWPNDIYWKDKKIGGILIENSLLGKTIDRSVIGVGLNINQKNFPDAVVNPVSLSQITGEVYDRTQILEHILKEFEAMYNSLQEGYRLEIEDKYFENLYRSQGYHWYEDKNGLFQAKIENVLSTGHLVLRAINEYCDRTYAFKEVQFINL